MRLSGYQPQYFPRLHYLNRALDSDIFEISDNIQFVRKHAFPAPDGSMKRGKSFQAHTVIKNVQGPFFMVIPTPDDLTPINKTKINYSQDWTGDHLKTIEVNYRRSPNFSKFFPDIEELLKTKYNDLASLTIKTVFWGIARLLTDEKLDVPKLDTEMINKLLNKTNPFRLRKNFLASQTPIPPPEKGEANKWIIALCKFANADEYFYGGTSHSSYMDLDLFKKEGIKTALQDWHCPSYNQQFPKTGFLPNLSIIDLVMNEDLKSRQNILNNKN